MESGGLDRLLHSAALFDMADVCIGNRQYAKAEQLLNDCLARPNLPENLKQLARIKLNLCLEKKKGLQQ